MVNLRGVAFPVKTVISRYGVSTIRRLLKMIGLFCKRALQKRLYSAKETYSFKEPTKCDIEVWGVYDS